MTFKDGSSVYSIPFKKILKYLIESGSLIPKRDSILWVPKHLEFKINGNVLFLTPDMTATSFLFDREINPEERPEYDKSKFQETIIEKFNAAGKADRAPESKLDPIESVDIPFKYAKINTSGTPAPTESAGVLGPAPTDETPLAPAATRPAAKPAPIRPASGKRGIF